MEADQEVALTKYLSKKGTFSPVYTGGPLFFLKNEQEAFGARDNTIVHFKVPSAEIIKTYEQEGDDIITFALAPTETILATSTKGYIIRIWSVAEATVLHTFVTQH